MLAVLAIAGCATPRPEPQLSFEDARVLFQSRGVQPGQKLPPLSLVDLNGEPASLVAVQLNRPLVIVTASLTCNVARRRQPDLNELVQQFSDTTSFLIIYTIDAHPVQDPCPYTGREWTMRDNDEQGIRPRQPTTLTERLTLARQYARSVSPGIAVLVDTMDNATWEALGLAPNLALIVNPDGVVLQRQGWFDPRSLELHAPPPVLPAHAGIQ